MEEGRTLNPAPYQSCTQTYDPVTNPFGERPKVRTPAGAFANLAGSLAPISPSVKVRLGGSGRRYAGEGSLCHPHPAQWCGSPRR